jgi:DNA-binding CsgD family transcriptional regulator
MNPKIDPTRKSFAPMLQKTLKNALAHRIAQDFPRIGGERIRQLCAEMILDVVQQHLLTRAYVQHGQVVWNAINVNDPPSRGKRTRDTALVPVVLTLVTPEDIQGRIEREPRAARLRRAALRLSTEAHAQGALLSNVDLALLLNYSSSDLGKLLAGHERTTGQVVPRRATLHDVGTGLTHKAIICRLHAAGKTSDQIARETHHSLDAVDRYLADFDRVRHCQHLGMSPEQIAFTLNHSRRLVQQYLDLLSELTPAEEEKND